MRYLGALIMIPVLLLTPVVTIATNESSYRYGYQQAYKGYKEAADSGGEILPPLSNTTLQCSPMVTHGIVSNPQTHRIFVHIAQLTEI